jgi:hypothetical protein
MVQVDSTQLLDNHEHFSLFPPPVMISLNLDSYPLVSCYKSHSFSLLFPPPRLFLAYSKVHKIQKQQDNMQRISSSSLFNHKTLAMDQKPEQSPLDSVGMRIDPEAGNGKIRAKARYFPSAPSIFRILSLGIIFLSVTAVVAGCISGDWGASSCKFTLSVSLPSPLPPCAPPQPFPLSLLSRSLVP